MDDGSVLETEWVTEMRIRWSARRAEAAGGTGGDGGAWLDGDAARAVACDAAITPVVTGDVNPAVLDDLVALCLQLAGHGPSCAPHPDPDPAGNAAPAGEPAPAGSGGPPAGLALLSEMSREAIRQAIIGKAADLLSGPGGLASFLRTRQLGARLAGPACPWTSAIPAPSRPGSATR
jgi:hypothetical protein